MLQHCTWNTTPYITLDLWQLTIIFNHSFPATVWHNEPGRSSIIHLFILFARFPFHEHPFGNHRCGFIPRLLAFVPSPVWHLQDPSRVFHHILVTPIISYVSLVIPTSGLLGTTT